MKWFKSYLSERSEYSNANDALCERTVIKCGVPQGSIIGPLTLLIYINDMSHVVRKCKVSMYADDTIVYYAFENENEIYQIIAVV